MVDDSPQVARSARWDMGWCLGAFSLLVAACAANPAAETAEPNLAAVRAASPASAPKQDARDLSWMSEEVRRSLPWGVQRSWNDFSISVTCVSAASAAEPISRCKDLVYRAGALQLRIGPLPDDGPYLCVVMVPPAGFGRRLLWAGVELRHPKLQGVTAFGGGLIHWLDLGGGFRAFYPLPAERWVDSAIPFKVVAFASK